MKNKKKIYSVGVTPLTGVLIAIDFDGTCTTHEYPDVGRDIGAESVLLDLVNMGALLILWTMRSDDKLADAVKWFNDRNIPLYGINENPNQKNWTNSPKAYAQVYVDDAALGAPLCEGLTENERPYINWDKVREILIPTI